VKPATSKLLGVISKELGKLGNPIVIEGHTDSHPLGSKPGYSNWELSADRANAARRAMENRGVQPGQIVGVRGFADRKPKDPDNPFHPMNRRVSILVAYSSGGGFGESASKEKESAQETKESAPKESAAKEEPHSGGEHSESSGHADSESHESDH
jgi:chemotaxis protein MotB